MVALGEGVRGCSGGGHVWLLPGGHAWLLWGGGVCGCSGGVCMVAAGGCMRGCSGDTTCAWDTTKYGDTINERAVHILLECILV